MNWKSILGWTAALATRLVGPGLPSGVKEGQVWACIFGQQQMLSECSGRSSPSSLESPRCFSTAEKTPGAGCSLYPPLRIPTQRRGQLLLLCLGLQHLGGLPMVGAGPSRRCSILPRFQSSLPQPFEPSVKFLVSLDTKLPRWRWHCRYGQTRPRIFLSFLKI